MYEREKMLKIMIVDDSLIIRNSLKQQFTELGHEVVASAKSAHEAITIYNQVKPDLVTMDITMPVMSGVEALVELISIDENANIVMVTSHGEENLVMDAISSGAKGYVLKPITHGKIIKTLAKVFPELAIETNN